MGLNYRAVVVNIDNKTRQVIAFAMHQSVCVGWGCGTKTEVLSQLEAVFQLGFPKCDIGFDGIKGNHSDGDGTVAHLSGAQKSVPAIKHLHPITDEGVF